MEKDRLDNLVHHRGLAASRERARALILEGKVTVNGRVCDKPGTRVDVNCLIECADPGLPFVSRGGLKLLAAIEKFDIDLAGKTVLDVGASTGGFTDCALQHGASHVVALDVGYGQLDWKLRTDPRVTVLERTNIRYYTGEGLPGKVDVATCDVSFISLTKVLPAIKNLVKDDGRFVLLIKPQFEAGKDKVGKNGVVRDPAVHREVICHILDYAASLSLVLLGLWYSPVRGPAGNIEYLAYFGNDGCGEPPTPPAVEEVVTRAHQEVE